MELLMPSIKPFEYGQSNELRMYGSQFVNVLSGCSNSENWISLPNSRIYPAYFFLMNMEFVNIKGASKIIHEIMVRKAHCPAIRKNGIMQSAASRNMSCRTKLCAIQSAVIFV